MQDQNSKVDARRLASTGAETCTHSDACKAEDGTCFACTTNSWNPTDGSSYDPRTLRPGQHRTQVCRDEMHTDCGDPQCVCYCHARVVPQQSPTQEHTTQGGGPCPHTKAALHAARQENERLRAELDEETRQFKNMHRALSARFGHFHDEKDWKRDQLSLEEYIAKKLDTAEARCDAYKAALDSLTNEVDGWLHSFGHELRDLLGNTNVNVMENRRDNARAVISQYEHEKEAQHG